MILKEMSPKSLQDIDLPYNHSIVLEHASHHEGSITIILAAGFKDTSEISQALRTAIRYNNTAGVKMLLTLNGYSDRSISRAVRDTHSEIPSDLSHAFSGHQTKRIKD